ncbi:hypothetical protein V2J17_07440 [Lysobacter yananisis]|uniref:hypothetical protein n=1 Tax=Lysobacter yananisis TaxID=1003114 RepID=UPI00300B9AF1
MINILSSGFEVAPFSDLDYDGMTVEIRYQGNPVAQLNKDNGLDGGELVIPSRFSTAETPLALPLDAFLEALTAARSLISELG